MYVIATLLSHLHKGPHTGTHFFPQRKLAQSNNNNEQSKEPSQNTPYYEESGSLCGVVVPVCA
jgi:hypothetical protein